MARTRARVCVLVAGLFTLLPCALAGGVQAAELKVLSAGAMQTIVSEVAEVFQKETGHKVTIETGTAGALQKRLVDGDPADVIIVTDTAIAALLSKGYLIGGTRTDLARTAIGVAVREGAPRPDIGTPDALKRTLLDAKSLVYLDPARGATSGIHFAQVLERLGIAEAMKPKTILIASGAAAEKVASGEAELCVHQISEILPVKGVALVGPLPGELQKVTTYSAGIPARVSAPDAAMAFVGALTRPAVKARLGELGLDYKE